MNPKLSRRVIARTVAAKLLAEPKRTRHWMQVVAAYLIEHNRVEEVDLVVNDIAHELFAQNGQLLVDVTSARALSTTLRDEIKRNLRKATGAKHVALSEHIDPDLLGGLIARTPDQQLDLSVRTRLRRLAAIT